jgi:hypothetical protein
MHASHPSLKRHPSQLQLSLFEQIACTRYDASNRREDVAARETVPVVRGARGRRQRLLTTRRRGAAAGTSAMVALAAKPARIMCAVLRSGQEFEVRVAAT